MKGTHELGKNPRARMLIKRPAAQSKDTRRIIVRVQAEQGQYNKFLNLATIVSKRGVYAMMTPLNYMTGEFEVIAYALPQFQELAKAEGLQVVK